jgi:sugar O-acyltransferase (sialic acid O-acetyltransferase NeuD family)
MKVVGVGAGGHAKVVIEILRQLPDCEIVGLIDPRPELWQTELLGIKVLGDDRLLPELRGRGIDHAFIGLGTIGDTTARRELYHKVVNCGFQIASAVDQTARVSPSANLGAGITVMAGAIINAAAHLGINVIVNTAAIVEHDCTIGDHVHIATGARLSGGVIVHEGAHIGLGAIIRQRIKIGRDAIVGAGAVVVKDVSPGTTVVGVPAKQLTRAKS